MIRPAFLPAFKTESRRVKGSTGFLLTTLFMLLFLLAVCLMVFFFARTWERKVITPELREIELQSYSVQRESLERELALLLAGEDPQHGNSDSGRERRQRIAYLREAIARYAFYLETETLSYAYFKADDFVRTEGHRATDFILFISGVPAVLLLLLAAIMLSIYATAVENRTGTVKNLLGGGYRRRDILRGKYLFTALCLGVLYLFLVILVLIPGLTDLGTRVMLYNGSRIVTPSCLEVALVRLTAVFVLSLLVAAATYAGAFLFGGTVLPVLPAVLLALVSFLGMVGVAAIIGDPLDFIAISGDVFTLVHCFPVLSLLQMQEGLTWPFAVSVAAHLGLSVLYLLLAARRFGRRQY